MKDDLKHFLEHEILGDGSGTTIGVDDELLMSGLVDSIGVMRLIAFIEETFQRQVPPEDVTLETFNSISAIAAYLDEKKS